MCETHLYKVDLLDPVGERFPATVEVSVWDRDLASGRRRDCKLRVQWEGGSVEAVEYSVYHAFASAREQLEPLGLTPQCFGACPEVQVSGMAVDMGDGTIAYRLRDPRDGWGGPTVNIFDSAPDISPAPVDKQRTYRKRRDSEHDSRTTETST